MAEYGFTSSDIASITQARSNLSAGFMQLGQQIEKDIERIATLRETRAFAAEMATLDPTLDTFPQQLIGTLSKYPLASQTNLAKQGIEVLSSRYKTAQEAKQSTNLFSDIGGGTMFNPKTNVAYRTNESGIPEFIDTTPQAGGPVRGTIVQTPEKQLLINPATGQTITEFAPRPQSTRSTNLNVLPQNVKMQVDNLTKDVNAVLTERQKLLDAINSGKITEDGQEKAYRDLANLESNLNNLKETRDKILREAGTPANSPAMPVGAGQGVNGPSLMPAPQSNSSFVPMDQEPVVSNPGMPNRDQMVLNQPGNAVLPDQLPVLPNTGVTPAQFKGPRLYRKVQGVMQYAGKTKDEIKKAIKQAYDDQQIGDEEADRALREAGFSPIAR